MDESELQRLAEPLENNGYGECLLLIFEIKCLVDKLKHVRGPNLLKKRGVNWRLTQNFIFM